MNPNFIAALLLATALPLLAAPGVELGFQPVALSSQLAPGLTNNVKFSNFEYVSLADDGRIAFTANFEGQGVTSKNKLGLWAGLPGDLRLVARTGDSMSGSTNDAPIEYLWKPNIDEHKAVGFLATVGEPWAQKLFGRYLIYEADNFYAPPSPPKPFRIIFGNLIGAIISAYTAPLGHVINTAAGHAQLQGAGIGPTNNIAIVAGPPTNAAIVAQKGSPAAGAPGNFTSFPTTSQALALMPDGNVAFIAVAEGSSGFPGLWFGKAGAVQAVALRNLPAPASLLGPGYKFGFVSIVANVEVNSRGELAFATTLVGPGLNNTNSAFVVAGPPGALRVIAQSGQPAPGIPGAVFADFSHVLLGTDGTTAFTASYTTNRTDYVSGLWLAPTNGATLRLLMHDGQRAPGTPADVYFTSSLGDEAYFMNSRNQIVFRKRLLGPGFDHFDNGIWLAEPDGTVHLIVRKGDMVDTGSGVKARVNNVTFGADPEFIAGPEDGRRTPFNDRGEVALQIYFDAPPPPFTGSGGIFIAQTGIILRADRTANDIRVKFPTLSGKHYRVEYKTNLSGGSWSVLAASVTGTGDEFVVTDPGVEPSGSRYYRVVRTD